MCLSYIYTNCACYETGGLAADWQQHWAALAAEQIDSRRGIHVFGSYFLGGHTHENGPF